MTKIVVSKVWKLTVYQKWQCSVQRYITPTKFLLVLLYIIGVIVSFYLFLRPQPKRVFIVSRLHAISLSTQQPLIPQEPLDTVHIASSLKCYMPVGATTMYMVLGNIPGPVKSGAPYPSTFSRDCPLAPWCHYVHGRIASNIYLCINRFGKTIRFHIST